MQGTGKKNKESEFNGHGVSAGQNEKTPETNGGECFKVMWTYFIPWTIYFKMVKMMNFMYYTLYHINIYHKWRKIQSKIPVQK